ncbi:MAG: tetratricopeptide repeat protein [Gammaproteobacteria bacterium]
MAKNRRRRNRRPATTPAETPRGRPSQAAPPAAPPPPQSLSQRLLQASPALLLLLMIAATYSPSFFAGFLWDDNIFTDAVPVKEWGGLKDIWFNLGVIGSESHYWPVLYTTFWLEHKLWGFDAPHSPWGFHTVNILLHSINTLLLWKLLLRMQVPGAWLIAAVFAVHPVHVEAVAWIIARKDLLATLFFLLAAGYWLRFREQSKSRHSPLKPRIVLYLLMLLMYTAGVLSKTVAITLPAILLVHVWWQHGRITWRDFLQVTPLFLLALILGIGDLNFFTGRTLIEFDYTPVERVIIISKALWFYAFKLLWPHPLLFIYHHWDINPANLLNWLALLATLGLVLTLWLARHRIGRGPLAGALFFGISLSPMLGVFNNSYMKFAYAADRYQYLPSAGLIAVLIAAAVILAQRWQLAARQAGANTEPNNADTQPPENNAAQPDTNIQQQESKPIQRLPATGIRWAPKALGALLLLACGVTSYQRAQTYEDKIVLFTHVTDTNPGAFEAYYNFGTFLMSFGRPEDAVGAFYESIEYYPKLTKAYVNLGSALMELDRHQEAVDVLRRAIEEGPTAIEAEKDPQGVNYRTAAAYINLGSALLELDQFPEAEKNLRHALKMEPESLQGYQNLAAVLLEQKRKADALPVLEKIAELMPKPTPGNYQQMATIATELGRKQKAEQYSLQAVALSLGLPSGHPRVLGQVAATRFNAGRYDEALPLFRRIAQAEPNNPEAHSNLGSALAQSGHLRQALESFERALTLDPQLESARTNMELARQKLDAGQ